MSNPKPANSAKGKGRNNAAASVSDEQLPPAPTSNSLTQLTKSAPHGNAAAASAAAAAVNVHGTPTKRKLNPMLSLTPRKAAAVSSGSANNSPVKKAVHQQLTTTMQQLKQEVAASIHKKAERMGNGTAAEVKTASGNVLIYLKSYMLKDGQRDFEVYSACQTPVSMFAAATPTAVSKRQASSVNSAAFDSDDEGEQSHASSAAAAAVSSNAANNMRPCNKKSEPIDGAPEGKQNFVCPSQHITTVDEGVMPSPTFKAEVQFYDCNEPGFVCIADAPAERDASKPLVKVGEFNEAPLVESVRSPGSNKSEGAVRKPYQGHLFDDACKAFMNMDAAKYFALGNDVDGDDATAMEALKQRTLEAQDGALGRVMLVRVVLERKVISDSMGRPITFWNVKINMPKA